jgi:CheY-like chemotaxis protein
MTPKKRAAELGTNAMADVHVVEDAPLVRRMITETLRDAGLHVKEAASAEAALAAVGASPHLPDVLVTDTASGSGGIDGCELAVELRRRSPRLGVIYLADHPMTLTDDAPDSRKRWLAKPFEPALLARMACEMVPPCPNPPRLIRGRAEMR